MILRSVRVSGWRCLVEAVELGPFGDGLNVVHAPNGTGKSTVFEAVRRVLLDGHRVAGRDVEALRPWGRALAPRVALEFAHGGSEYRITKQFLDSPSALLERRDDGRYRPLAEGAGADEQTRALLAGHPPGRGLSRRENWGLAQVLWAPQGGLVLAELSADLVAAIRAALGTQVAGRGADPIERRIEERYAEYYSPTGRIRSGREAPRCVRLEEELERARQELATARAQHQAYDEASRRVEDLGAQRTQAGHELEELSRLLQQARQRATEYRSLVDERAQRQDRSTTAEAQYGQLKQRIELIAQTEQERTAAVQKAAELKAVLPLQAREAQDRARAAERMKSELEDARQGRAEVDRADRQAEEAQRLSGVARSQGDLDALWERIRAAQQLLAERTQRQTGFAAPSPRELNAVRRAVAERNEAQVRLEASLITLEVVPDGDRRLEVIAGEQPGAVDMSAGTPTRVQGSPEVVVRIPDVVRMRASGPTGSAEEHRRSRALAEEKIARLTAPYGTADLDALEGLVEKANELSRGVAEARTQLETLLAGRQPEQIRQERARAKADLAALLEAHPDWAASPPDPAQLRAAAERTRQAFIQRVESAEDAWSQAQSALAAAAGQEEMVAAQLKEAGARVDALERRLGELGGDGRTASERQAELGRLAMAWDAARARLEEVARSLAEFGDRPEETAVALERQLEAARASAQQAREQEVRERARLEGLSEQGPYSGLAAAEEQVAALEQELEAERLRVDAIRLLRETLAACRTEAVAAVGAPVELEASRVLQRIAGPRLGRIRVGESLEPVAVQPEASGDGVPPDSVSFGEQEQLHLATRLALGSVLAREERQLLALDDVLTATDAGRRARIMTVLEEAAQRLQILILTCHPEHYRGLRDARFFDLEAILGRQP